MRSSWAAEGRRLTGSSAMQTRDRAGHEWWSQWCFRCAVDATTVIEAEFVSGCRFPSHFFCSAGFMCVGLVVNHHRWSGIRFVGGAASDISARSTRLTSQSKAALWRHGVDMRPHRFFQPTDQGVVSETEALTANDHCYFSHRWNNNKANNHELTLVSVFRYLKCEKFIEKMFSSIFWIYTLLGSRITWFCVSDSLASFLLSQIFTRFSFDSFVLSARGMVEWASTIATSLGRGSALQPMARRMGAIVCFIVFFCGALSCFGRCVACGVRFLTIEGCRRQRQRRCS